MSSIYFAFKYTYLKVQSTNYFGTDVVNFVRSKLIEKFKTSLADSLSENRNGHIGKLRTYSLFKHRLWRTILKYITDKEVRRCFTNLRISCH